VASCCDPGDYDAAFSERFARRTARRYRNQGLSKAALAMVQAIERNGVDGATVLEIGGGVGQIQVELLRRGAAHAVNLELSTAYEDEARRLLEESGYADRVERRMLDIAAAPDEVEPADVVVLHRVVCCYPDYARLLGTAADHARRQLVFSHPPRNLISRLAVWTENATYRLRGSDFRVFAHPPKAMLGVLAGRGFSTTTARPQLGWHVAIATRLESAG
jgi:magnesium-protoporphyrin O-methyltransferase